MVSSDANPAALAEEFVARHKLKAASIPVITRYIQANIESKLKSKGEMSGAEDAGKGLGLSQRNGQGQGQELKKGSEADSLGPFIVVLCSDKAKREEDLAFEFRRKGFLVCSSTQMKDGLGFLLSLSPKLLLKMALEANQPVLPFLAYTPLQRLPLACAAMSLIARSKGVEVWIAHDREMLRSIAAAKGEDQLSQLKHYYGSKIAIYFGWLAFYTDILLYPSVFGGLLFLYQLWCQDVDSGAVPLFCVAISVWSTYFLEFWKRQGNSLAYSWGVFGVEDDDNESELANATVKEDSGVTIRLFFSFATVMSIVYVMIKVMLTFRVMRDSALEVYGVDSWLRFYPMLVYSALPCIFSSQFCTIAEKLNRFERRSTKVEAENSLILKHFVLEFCNRYCALLYTVFWLRDLVQLRSLLVSLLTTSALINNFMEVGLPAIKKWSKRQGKQGTPHPSLSSSSSPIPAKLSITSANTPANVSNMSNMSCPTPRRFIPGAQDPAVYQSSMREVLAQELSNETYDLNADYLELVIQYGYVTMFVVAFPLAPALALLNNLFESKVDMFKLTECRRPPLLQRSSMGSWQSCLEMVAFLSVITNCFLLVMVSKAFAQIMPTFISRHLVLERGRLVAMVLLEHILLGFKVLLMYLIDDVPMHIQEAVATQRKRDREKEKEDRMDEYDTAAAAAALASPRPRLLKSLSATSEPKEKSFPGSPSSTMSAPVVGNSGFMCLPRKISDAMPLEKDEEPAPPEVVAVGGEVAEDGTSLFAQSPESEEERAVDQCSQVDQTDPYFFEPAQMSLLIALPMVLHHLQISPWIYIPLASTLFGVLQMRKRRIDRAIAINVASDPSLLKLILEQTTGDGGANFQKMEWTNYMLQKFWPMLAIVAEEKALRIGQPILDRMKPSFLSELKIKKFNFGTIAPHFLGIRMHETGNLVRCDVDMRYAGDPQIIIQVGPTVVEIVNLRISCVLRCECLEFTPKMTPFKLASATVMKKPFVDFNIKVAGMDIMGTKSMTNLVHTLFHKALASVAMFPKKIFVPMGEASDEATVEALKVLNPVGIIYLTLERGVDLIQANIFGSDPYVEIETIDQLLKSETVFSTVNPQWDEAFDIVVYDRGSQVLSFQVFDWDAGGNNKSLGRAELEVYKLPFNRKKHLTLQLTGADKGSIVVSCVYMPVGVSAPAAKRKPCSPLQPAFKGGMFADADVLFDLSPDQLQSDDVLLSDDLAIDHLDVEADRSLLLSSGLAILTISHINLRCLKADHGWKPTVSFTLGAKTSATHQRKAFSAGSPPPPFEERFVFVVKTNAKSDSIYVKIMDKKKIMSGKKTVGGVHVPLIELIQLSEAGSVAVIEREYAVQSDIDCLVTFKMQWASASNR